MSEKSLFILNELPVAQQAAMDQLLKQVLLLAVERAGGGMKVPRREIDNATVGKILLVEFDEDGDFFTFRIGKAN